jgi:hypothetical protein
MNSLFRQNLILKAKSAYTGNWKTASKIFDLYDLLVDVRAYNESYENYDVYEQRRDIYNIWKEVLFEHRKHLTLNEELVDKITYMTRQIDSFFAKNMSDNLKLLGMAKLAKYKEFVQALIAYTQDFLKQLGFNTKVLKVKSEYTGLMTYAITLDMSESESFVSEQIDMNNAFKQKLFYKFKQDLEKKDMRVEDEGDHFVIKQYGVTIGYVSDNKFDKIYPTLEELNHELKKNQIIDDNYDKLVLGESGQLLTPTGTVATTLNYLPPKTLASEIKKYNESISLYNSKLKPYEPKLSNDPKTIQLGEYTLKVVKVFYKNINRPVITEGPYAGIFLDQIVSPTGKVLGSSSKASPYFISNKQVYEAISDSVKKKDTLDIEQNVVSKKVQEYQRERNYYPYQYERMLKSNIQDKKIRTAIPDLTGASILNDVDSNMDAYVESNSYDKFTNIDHNIKMDDSRTKIRNLEITRSVHLIDGKPEYIKNEYFEIHPCMPDGLGTKVFTQQVKSASELGFKYIKTDAGGGSIGMVGYYVWPKLGYNGDLSDDLKQTRNKLLNNPTKNEKELNTLSEIDTWFQNTLGHSVYDECMALDLYACKVNGKFIGQEIWKKHGSTVTLKFDLTEGSLSMRILGDYINKKSKEMGIAVADFINTDISKYRGKNNNLECLLRKYYDNIGRMDYALLNALKIAIKNQENGEIVKILNSNDYDIRQPLIDFVIYLSTSKRSDERQVAKEVQTIARINKSTSYPNLKFASDKNLMDDPMIREVDFAILDQVWDGINKLYESGNF